MKLDFLLALTSSKKKTTLSNRFYFQEEIWGYVTLAKLVTNQRRSTQTEDIEDIITNRLWPKYEERYLRSEEIELCSCQHLFRFLMDELNWSSTSSMAVQIPFHHQYE